MADKDATVYVVDLGKSMGERSGGREVTDLEWSMNYVWDKIATTVSTGRKTLHIGVLGLRTDETKNSLGEEEAYQHITELMPLGQMLMPGIRDLQTRIKPSRTEEGDAISALVLAIDMIGKHCKKLKYTRRIVLITNGRGSMDVDGVESISSKVKEDGMELVVLGVDFDDLEFGFKEEEKDPVKVWAHNERVLHDLVDDCDGIFGTVAQAIDEMSAPRLKSTRPTPSYRGSLMLGDPDKYDTAMTIAVERYPRTMVARPPTASSFASKAEGGGEGDVTQSSGTIQEYDNPDENDLTQIKTSRVYQIPDQTAPGGKREVDRDELAKGFEYGRTAVHISESERNIVDLETTPGMEIIGFIPADNYERFLNMSRSNAIIASKTSKMDNMALSSLIHGLYELNTYAIARFVAKAGNKPIILLLAPSIESDFECLVDVELPFAEDIRNYKFPPLDKVITVSGKTLTQHRYLPSDDLVNAMSDYVDAMDLATFGRDEDGEPSEYMPMDETFSPVLHRVNQVIRWRAIHPNAEIPPPPPILTKYSNPPEEILQKAKLPLSKVVAAANVKKVPPKVSGRKRKGDVEKPLSGLDVESLLGREKRVKISPNNAIPEFKQMLATTEEMKTINDATEQMISIVEDKIRNSTGDAGYAMAMECISVLREELTELEEPVMFNDFMRSLKEKVKTGKLGGDRREMWYRIRSNRLGLIDKRLSPFSDVSEEEAKQFLALKS